MTQYYKGKLATQHRGGNIEIIERHLFALKRANQETSFKVFSANMALDMGVSLKKMEEYLDILEQAKRIKLNKGRNFIEISAERYQDLNKTAPKGW
jgi:hypothetical protein